jgi:hypothetical protein
LLTNWRQEVARVSRVLSIDIKVDEAAIDEFLTRDLHRQRHCGQVTETFSYNWVSRVYTMLCTAAQDRAIEVSELDEIYNAYQSNARTFRIALDAYRNGMNPEQVRELNYNVPIWIAGRDFDESPCFHQGSGRVT